MNIKELVKSAIIGISFGIMTPIFCNAIIELGFNPFNLNLLNIEPIYSLVSSLVVMCSLLLLFFIDPISEQFAKLFSEAQQ